ncbi:MAG: oligosaccharide flippase family protein [Dehalococcoidia bacterium]
MENSSQKALRDFLIIGVSNVLVALSSVISIPLITKTLGANDYGLWSQAQVTMFLLLGFTGLGLPVAMTRFLPAKTNKEEIRDEFYSVLALVSFTALIISIILLVFADFIAEAFFEGATGIVRITGLIILVDSVNVVFLSYLRSFQQMKTYSLFTIAGVYGHLGLVVYLVLSGYGIFSVVLAALVVKVLIFFSLFFLIKRQIGIRWPRFSKIREYLGFGIFLIPATMSVWVPTATGIWVIESSNRFIISYVLGTALVGTYSAAYVIAKIPMIMIGIISFVLLPMASKLYDEGQIDEVKRYMSYALRYYLVVTIPFVFACALLAKPILKAFSTAEIAREGDFVIPIVALGTLLYGVSLIVPLGLTLAKRAKLLGAIWIITIICNFLLAIWLVPMVGIEGAALATLIAFSLALGIAVYFSWKELSFRIDWMFIAKTILASMAMSLVIWRISPQETEDVIITIAAGAVIYGIALLLLKAFPKEEVAFFKQLLRRT